jgi:hypothetical protein
MDHAEHINVLNTSNGVVFALQGMMHRDDSLSPLTNISYRQATGPISGIMMKLKCICIDITAWGKTLRC